MVKTTVTVTDQYPEVEAQKRYEELVKAGAPSDLALNAVRQIPGAGGFAPSITGGGEDIGVVSSQDARDKVDEDIDRLNKIEEGEEGFEKDEIKETKDKREDVLSADEKDALGIEDEEPEEEKKIREDVEKIDDEIDDIEDDLESWKKSYDTLTNTLITNIQEQYERRRSKLKDINKRAAESLRTYGMRMGTARYSPLIATGVVSAEERAGQARLADLDAEEARLITEAKMAKSEQDYSMLREKMGELEAKRAEKMQVLEDLQKATLEHNKEVAETERGVQIDSRVAALWDVDITDPVDIYNLLNPLKDDGSRTNDITLDEITSRTKTLPGVKTEEEWSEKLLTPDQAIKYGVSLGTTWGQVSEAGIVPERWQEGKEDEGEGLDRDEQWDAAIGFVENNIDEEGFDYESADMWLRRLAPKLTDADIKSILSNVGLKPAKERKKEEEEKEEKFLKLEVEDDVDIDFNSYIKKFFTEGNLEDAVKGAGKAGGIVGWFVSDKEMNDYLSSLRETAKAYRGQGYNDKEIWNSLYNKIQSDIKAKG
jgi:hypothetical protein